MKAAGCVVTDLRNVYESEHGLLQDGPSQRCELVSHYNLTEEDDVISDSKQEFRQCC